MDKETILKQVETIDAAAASIRVQRAQLVKDLATAQAAFKGERGGLVAALLGRGKSDPEKPAARLKLDALPEAIGTLDRELAEVLAPRGALERALLQLEAAEIPAQAEALYRKLAAVINDAQPDYQALCVLAERQYELRREHGIQPDPYQRGARDFMLLVSGIGLAAERLADVEIAVTQRLKMMASLPT
jgi:uncharacterized protein YhaN